MMPVHSHQAKFGGNTNDGLVLKHSHMKRRSQSHKNQYQKIVKGRRSLSKENVKRTTSSVDSGAGAEDEESESHAASEEIEENNNNIVSKHPPSKETSAPSSQTLKRKSSGRRSKSHSAGERTSRNQTASDSAVSTSVLSTSGLSTPTESRIFSSPNLSDHSKTSFSPKHSNHPPLSIALRKKQERLKRELDIKETRFQIERQRFTEDTYRSHRVSSGKNKENSSFKTNRSLQRSQSIDLNNSQDRKMESDHRPTSSKREEKRFNKESRSKSVDPNDREAVTTGTRHDSITTTHKGDTTASASIDKETIASHDGNKHKELTDIPTPSQSSIQTNSNSFYSETAGSGERELEYSISDTKLIDKKQRRKSRKDRSSSLRRRQESKENVDDKTINENKEPRQIEDYKIYTDSDDVFENAAKKLVKASSITTTDLDKRMAQAIDSILRDGMPDIPTTEQITETGLLDWRAVFRVEMMRLRREVNEFRVFCQKQVQLQAKTPGRSVSGESVGGQPDVLTAEPVLKNDPHPPIVANQLRDLQANMKLFQKKQQLLDLETELLGHEERLAEKQEHLEEYEKEILEVESMLNHRQAICDRRQKTLLSLDEELQNLRSELEETREQMNVDGSIPESNSERARKNWDMLKRNLMDEQKLLETTVQKYRSELASATSTIAGKDILISRLQTVAMQHEEDIASRDKRIKQLESKLSIALSETKSLIEQLPSSSQRDLHHTSYKENSELASRRLSTEVIPENQRVSSFRSSTSYYRRPSSNATSEHGDSIVHGPSPDESVTRNSLRASRKRNSVSDNAISRLTLSTPRTEDKFGRTSSACVVQ